MPVSLHVEVDKTDIARLEKTLAAIPKGANKAIMRAVNKTATTVRSKIVKSYASWLNLRQKSIREQTVLTKAKYSRLYAVIKIKSERFKLIAFKARATPRGVRYKILKSSGPKTEAGTFIATMPSGHTGVYHRTSPKRLPIREKTVVGLTHFLPHIDQEAIGQAPALLKKNLDTQVRLLLERGR